MTAYPVRLPALQLQAERRHAYEQNRERIAQLWAESQPIRTGDAAHRFLQCQGLNARAVPDTLRLHSALDYWHFDGAGKPLACGAHPALLAALQVEFAPFHMTQLHTVALLRVYLDAQGNPAPVPSFMKLTGVDGQVQGASIRLCPPQHKGKELRLGVAVGLRAALQASRATRLPFWAVLSTEALASFRWPRGLTTLHAFVDDVDARPVTELLRKASACGVEAVAHAIEAPADTADDAPHHDSPSEPVQDTRAPR